MTPAANAADVLESLKGHALLTAQVALKGEGLRRTAQLLDVGVAEVFYPDVRADTGFGQNLLGTGKTDAIHVGEGNLNALFAWDINAGNPSHVGIR
jgi:hypothetical protein